LKNKQGGGGGGGSGGGGSGDEQQVGALLMILFTILAVKSMFEDDVTGNDGKEVSLYLLLL